MKRVAVVGGGPGGLVTAKNLLRQQAHEFEVTIFEKQDRVGGMWALRPDELYRGKCNPQMPTNLSRHTVSFSDLAWDSVDLAGSSLPMYPKAWQVGRYLEEYAKRYIPAETLRLNTQVDHVKKVEIEGTAKWKVSWSPVKASSADDVHFGEKEGAQNDGIYDHVVVASGFFSTPRDPSFKLDVDPSLTILHSSQFRVMKDLVSDREKAPGNILVVGGSMSGAEAAVAIAMAQSNLIHSPNTETKVAEHDIIHITSRPFYDLPRLHARPSPQLPEEQMDHSPRFLPNDLNMFDLSKRPPGPLIPTNGLVPPEAAKMLHAWMQSIIGGNQRDLNSPGLSFADEHGTRPPFLAITDNYTEFARSGSIKTMLGRLEKVQSSESNAPGMAVIRNGEDEEQAIQDVVGVVYATGYTPHTALSWLDHSVRKDLEADEQSDRVPLLLRHHTTYHPSHPDLAFVGMYEGAFWGVMEMQAREAVKRWSDDESGQSPTLDWAEPDMSAMREAMKIGSQNVPQFWMGDYVSIVDALAPRHAIKRTDTGFGERAGPMSASRYLMAHDDLSEATKALSNLQSVLKDSEDKNRFVQGAIFRGLQGRWKITRKLESFLPGFPSGTMNGCASFHPRFPSAEGYDSEFLYVEEGAITTDAGLTLNANKRYVYRYSEAQDQVSVWFVKEDGKTVDYFFHNIQLAPKSQQSHEEGWEALGSHWCDPDQYDCTYRFKFRGATLEDLSVKFVVKGPRKDYISNTKFNRP